MPHGKKIQTPSKQPESSSMTHEEEEEMQHDISKLQDQVQQLSLTQKGTESKMDGLKKDVEAKMDVLKKGVEAKMDCLKKGIEAKMNDVEAKMDDLKIDLKTDMEELKINMNKLLQERVTKGERVVKETHDEKKINVNHDSIDSNVGSKTHHISKIDMRKFDGKEPATWILQMEQFFDLNNVQNTQKVRMATLYLEPNQFVWYQWLCSRKQIITWAIFTEELTTHYKDTKSNTFFSQLISLKQKGSIMEHIEEFQKLNIRVKDIPEEHRIDVFIGSLKDNIQHDVRLWEPDSLEKAFRLARKMESKIMATRKHTTHNYKDGSVVAPSLPQPIRLTPQQLEEKRSKRDFLQL